MVQERDYKGRPVPNWYHAAVDVWPKHEGARTVHVFPGPPVEAVPKWWELHGQYIKAKTRAPKKWAQTKDWTSDRMWDAFDVATDPLVRMADKQERRRLEGGLSPSTN